MGSRKFSSSKKVIVTLFVNDIKNDIENIGDGKFRIGKINIAIDHRRIIEIADEYGNRCRISGPAGLTNLSKYLAEISKVDIGKGKEDKNPEDNKDDISGQKFVTPVVSDNNQNNHDNSVDRTIKNVKIPEIENPTISNEKISKKDDLILLLTKRCKKLEEKKEIYKIRETYLEEKNHDIEYQINSIKKEKQEIEEKARKSIEEKILLEEKYKNIEQERDQTIDLIEYLGEEFKNITQNVNKLSAEKFRIENLGSAYKDEIEKNYKREKVLISEKKEIENNLMNARKIKENAEEKLKLITKNNLLLEEKIATLQNQYNEIKSEFKNSKLYESDSNG